MKLSAVDLQLINALGINLHTGTQATRRWCCRLRLADNASEPGDHVEQKQIQINSPLESCQGNKGCDTVVQALMMECAVIELSNSSFGLLEY